MTLCAVMNVQAQTIQVGQKFWDGYELYIVQEIRLGTIVSRVSISSSPAVRQMNAHSAQSTDGR